MSSSFYVTQKGIKPTLEDLRETNHTKKVKDTERAYRSRKRAFGADDVSKLRDKPDPKHIIKGRTLGGQQKEVDKQELTKALAKDDFAVKTAMDVLKKQK